MPKKKQSFKLGYPYILLLIFSILGFSISLTPGITGYSIFESGGTFNLVFFANLLALIGIFILVFYPSDQPTSIYIKKQKKHK